MRGIDLCTCGHRRGDHAVNFDGTCFGGYIRGAACVCIRFVPHPQPRLVNEDAVSDHCLMAKAKIKDRLAELEKVYVNYQDYLKVRMAEQDWHGAWDASVNLSETSCTMDGLKFALEALGG